MHTFLVRDSVSVFTGNTVRKNESPYLPTTPPHPLSPHPRSLQDLEPAFTVPAPSKYIPFPLSEGSALTLPGIRQTTPSAYVWAA